jgi:hypothetical protein
MVEKKKRFSSSNFEDPASLSNCHPIFALISKAAISYPGFEAV